MLRSNGLHNGGADLLGRSVYSPPLRKKIPGSLYMYTSMLKLRHRLPAEDRLRSAFAHTFTTLFAEPWGS